ncbi:unnamed protein product [Sphagnum troendelagicum]|uniref:Uncharacterized protein n=1 Tax=Sphagnum troendelagicum TaxID=128251 RepID=A0ABP0TYX1_9BRYO
MWDLEASVLWKLFTSEAEEPLIASKGQSLTFSDYCKDDDTHLFFLSVMAPWCYLAGVSERGVNLGNSGLHTIVFDLKTMVELVGLQSVKERDFN